MMVERVIKFIAVLVLCLATVACKPGGLIGWGEKSVAEPGEIVELTESGTVLRVLSLNRIENFRRQEIAKNRKLAKNCYLYSDMNDKYQLETAYRSMVLVDSYDSEFRKNLLASIITISNEIEFSQKIYFEKVEVIKAGEYGRKFTAHVKENGRDRELVMAIIYQDGVVWMLGYNYLENDKETKALVKRFLDNVYVGKK